MPDTIETEDIDVLQVILDEIHSDFDYDQNYMLHIYNDADEKGKELLDDFLIALCGWSLPTLMQKAKKNN